MRISAYICAAAALSFAVCSGPTTPPVSTYLLGEKVQLGKLSYTVFETQWMTHLGDGPTARVPQHRFFLVRFSAVNSGSSDVAVPNLSIRDDAGHVYEELSNGEDVPQWAGYLRTVRPADSVQGNAVFDAPPGHYKLKIMDDTITKTAMIDIPLTFGAEAPEVVVPGEKK